MVSFLPMEAIGETGGLDLGDERELGEIGSGYSFFADGDVLVAKITPCFENGKGAVARGLENGIGFGTTEVHVLRPRTNLDSRFLYYLTASHHFREAGTAVMYGAGGQKRIPDEFVLDFQHPVPSLPLQSTIADFLDRETARIDELIAQKERMIELLEEKRTALLESAVTPKSSESCWSQRKLRRLIERVQRPVRVRSNDHYREIGIRSWGRGIFHKEEVPGEVLGNKRVFRVEPEDLTLNIVFAWEGAVAVVGPEEAGMIASHRFPTFRINKSEVHLDYLLMYLQSEHGRVLMSLNSPGAAGRNRTLRISAFLDEELPLPDLTTQIERSATYRDGERTAVELKRDGETMITLLREYRSALISAAVTGKISIPEANDHE